MLLAATLWFIVNLVQMINGSGNPPQARQATNPLPGWDKSGDMYFKCFDDTPQNYNTVRSACGGYGGRLAAKILRDPTAVRRIISSGCVGGTKVSWIGYDDIEVEGNWKWADGRLTNNDTTAWYPGEPNGLGNENCGSIWAVTSDDRVLVNDLPCEHLLSTYICEVEVQISCSEEQRINNCTFPETRPGLVSNSKELCPDSSVRKASIICTREGKYDLDSLVVSTCESIEFILRQNFTNTTLQLLQLATTNASTLTADNAVDISNFLYDVSNFVVSFSERQVGATIEITSHLGDFYQQYEDSDFPTEKQNLVKSVNKISRKLQSVTSNNMSFSTTSEDVDVEVRDVTLSNASYSFNASFYSDDATAETKFVPMSVTLPAEAIDEAKRLVSSSSVRIVSVGFRSSSLFPSTRTTDWVVSTSLGNSTDSVEGLTLTNETVLIRNNRIGKPGTKKLDDFKNEVTELQCVFWDFQTGGWSGEGCSLLSTSPATCQCDHLTNFAILVSRSVIPADFSLSIVTYVGCALSIVGHFLTLLVIWLSKQMRGKYQMKIVANISFCLLVAMTFFVFGVGALEPEIGCTLITVFMQFFFLAAWFWAAVYSFVIYRDIVKTMITYGESFKFRFAAPFAYGTPFLIVLMNASITLGVIDRNRADSSYRAQNFCWLHHHSLYFGFLLVVGILLLFNLWVFLSVIPEVTCKRSKIQSSKEKSSVRQHLVTVVALVTTMGLAWIFGFLMLVSDNHAFLLAMSWLFTIVNAFQGVFIFYFTAVRSGELVRLCTGIRGRSHSTPTASTGASSAATETTN